jgi:hypothetical protein
MPTSNRLNLLIVEDDEPKLEAIKDVISESTIEANIIVARSVASSLNVMKKI